MGGSSFSHGRVAEEVAVEYLKKQKYEILEQNYRNRYCEIDIVAKKNKSVYFVEVKYRKSSAQGTGLDYINAKKLKQMRFASEMWVQEHGWTGDYELSAIEVSGQDFRVAEFISQV